MPQDIFDELKNKKERVEYNINNKKIKFKIKIKEESRLFPDIFVLFDDLLFFFLNWN